MSKSLYIKNISKQDIHLSDLGIIIKSFKTINLYNIHRFHFTEEQINNSIKSGSIFKRKNKIIFIENLESITKSNTYIKTSKDNLLYDKNRSLIERKKIKIDDLDDDLDFAIENSDLAKG